jgi:hypothetical protein
MVESDDPVAKKGLDSEIATVLILDEFSNNMVVRDHFLEILNDIVTSLSNLKFKLYYIDFFYELIYIYNLLNLKIFLIIKL